MNLYILLELIMNGSLEILPAVSSCSAAITRHLLRGKTSWLGLYTTHVKVTPHFHKVSELSMDVYLKRREESEMTTPLGVPTCRRLRVPRHM